MISPVSIELFNLITKLIKLDDLGSKWVGLTLVALLGQRIDFISSKAQSSTILNVIYKIIKQHSDSQLFTLSVKAWEALFLSIHSSSSSSKDVSSLLNQVKLIMITIVRGLGKLFKVGEARQVRFVVGSILKSIQTFPASLRNVIAKKSSQKDLIVGQIEAAVDQFEHDPKTSKILLQLLSKIYLTKERRSHAYGIQLEQILGTIQGFWVLLKPVYAGDRGAEGIAKGMIEY